MLTRLITAATRLLSRPQTGSSALKAHEDGFKSYRRSHPEATFAQFYVAQAMQTIRSGKAHSTLGLQLYEARDGKKTQGNYFDAGRAVCERYRRSFNMLPEHRIVDYGCGSLRLGIHFMKFLEAGNFMGLDVTRDFIDIGVSASPALIARKKPILRAIDDAALACAQAFGADFIVSNAVSYHIHPDEKVAYLGNLATISTKPGARLIFDVRCCAEPTRFRNRSWAYPLDFYIDRLKPLSFVRWHRHGAPKNRDKDGILLESGILEFRRD